MSDRYSPDDPFRPDMRAFAMLHPFWGGGLGPPPPRQDPWELASTSSLDPSPDGLLANLGKPPPGGLLANLGKPAPGSGGLFGGLWPDPEPPTRDHRFRLFEPFGKDEIEDLLRQEFEVVLRLIRGFRHSAGFP